MMARVGGWFFMVLVFGGLAWGLLSLPEEPPGLAPAAHEALPRSGVSNPVTAVLLNYRAYDTLLEVAVLVLAIVAVWSLRARPATAFAAPASPMLGALLRLLLPLVVLAGGYLLWIGAFAPGGAFQGGALLGGAIVLLLLGGMLNHRVLLRTAWLKAGLVVGLTVFIAVGLGTMLAGRSLLEYPETLAGTLILVIEAAALVSIGLTLGALFFGGRPEPDPDTPKGSSRA
ncbi:MAG TPA: sodium:proton antiporter [Verrucomicrobiales bacterium]|nr:sodium:proton antiporter [Verrucomicrobiales bacterium]